MQTNKTAQTITLNDGRKLGYAEYGDIDGKPIFYFTGGNSSRLEGAWFADIARQNHVHIISTDRPGFGLSDIQLNRTLLDWPDDIGQLADSLGVDQFAIFGLSGGGPHVAALAYKIPERITAAAIVSGCCPYGVPGTFEGMWAPIRLIYFLAHRAPLWLNQRVQGGLNNPDNLIKNKDRLAAPDTAILTNRPELGVQFRESQIESVRNGTQGAAYEWKLYTRPWGFSLEDISKEIYLWYGGDDINAPPAMGRYMATKLPHNQLHVLPDEAHFSLINNHINAILQPLIAQ